MNLKNHHEHSPILKFTIPPLLLLIIFLSFIGKAYGNVTSDLHSSMFATPELCRVKNNSDEIDSLKQAILASSDLTEAKSLALAPTLQAISALNKALMVVPFSDDIMNAQKKLEYHRQLLEQAMSIQDVANRFDNIMIAGLDNDNLATVKAGGIDCNYSTGETIAIVVGLILGIIPGIILLVVLC